MIDHSNMKYGIHIDTVKPLFTVPPFGGILLLPGSISLPKHQLYELAI